MTLPRLTIITAGAGSGKTYTLQHQIGKWIEDGLVAPERIVAVTFTEAAATELRERIRGHLIEMNRLEDALRLDAAYISTIHSFGLRLLTEFAFEAGMSPNPRRLTESEQETLVRLAIATTNRADFMMDRLASYGYRYDGYSGTTAEQAIRKDVHGSVDLLRRSGWQDDRPFDSGAMSDGLRQGYGFTQNGDNLNQRLQEAVLQLLDEFPRSLADQHPGNASATRDLIQDFRNLQNVANSRHESDWRLWQSLRSMRKSKRGAALPERYDELATAVIETADELPSHPGPLEQALRQSEGIVGAAQDVLQHYGEDKRKAGLVDYTDMVALAERLLKTNPEVIRTVKGRIQCLIIDEFQDTNPLQFSLLWSLTEAGIPTLAVGDLKQAIMGFQGADSRLLGALEKNNPECTRTLPANYRTQPPLLDFINAVGGRLFGDGYASQRAEGHASDLKPLAIIRFSGRAKHAERAAATANYIRDLLGDPDARVYDKRLEKHRPLCGSDIAVLCETHSALMHYNTALIDVGMRTRLQQAGWHQSRVVQIVCHALMYIANPADRYAALYLSVTELGERSLSEGLDSLISHGNIEDNILQKLGEVEAPMTRPIPELISAVIDSLDLFGTISRWPDADQARANLVRAQGEATNFIRANREALAAGGFHGYGVQTFLSWLAEQSENEKEDIQPAPRVVDEHAINLVTMHKAKGREWPVVVVGFLERKIAGKLPASGINYESFDNPGNALDTARIWYTPRFDAAETNERFLRGLDELEELESKRLLYVALTRAREKLVIEWPEFYNSDATCYWSILRDSCGAELDESEIKIDGVGFRCEIVNAGTDVGVKAGDKEIQIPLTPFGRRAIEARPMPTELTPDGVTPAEISAPQLQTPTGDISIISYGDGLKLDLDLDPAGEGTLIHRCFEVLGQQPGLSPQLRKIIDYPFDGTSAEKIAISVAAFEGWLANKFPNATIFRELPVMAANAEGSVVSGVADLVIQSSNELCIVDHKSTRSMDLDTAFSTFVPQLLAYSEVLTEYFGNQYSVTVGVNWTYHGKVWMLKRR